MAGDYSIEPIYQGGFSSFKPLGTSPYFKVANFAETTDPRTANLIQEVSNKLSSGVKHIEIEMVSPEVFDSVPKQHFQEVARLKKITGIGVSMHGPVVNVSGINMQGGGYSESDRVAAERKIFQTLDRGHELDPKGNIIVNFHTSEGVAGSEIKPMGSWEDKNKREHSKILAIEKDSGRLVPVEKETKYFPGGKTGVREEPQTPEMHLETINRSAWDNELSGLVMGKERADEILEKNKMIIQHLPMKELMEGKIKKEDLNPTQIHAINQIKVAEVYLDDTRKKAANLFHKAWKCAETGEFGEKQKAMLSEIGKEYDNAIKKEQNIFGITHATNDLLLQLKDLERTGLAPNTYTTVEEFSIQKASQTYANAMFESYKKFGDGTPTLVLENPPAGHTLSSGEDVKRTVEETRKKFAEKLVQEKDLSEKEAKKIAEKFVGATLDVGHMNMWRKYGYSEKEIVAESKKLAPFLKHLHLSDNFGMEHTELPMGMGNVPLQEIMAELKKNGAKEEEMVKVIEAGHWWNHMKTSPFGVTLENMGSPVYTRGQNYWNQNQALSQGYFGGYGMFLPSINYEIFGGGFSALPTELGGQRGGAGQGNRMSGRGME